MVPISFVFEHMATLNDMDREFAELARSQGITNFVRARQRCLEAAWTLPRGCLDASSSLG